MELFVQALLFALLFVPSAAFDLTTPDPLLVNQTFNSRYTLNETDLQKATMIGVVLLALDTKIPCPKGPTGLAFEIRDIADGYATVNMPPDPTQLSENLLFRPQRPGSHLLCAYR
ncbi:hypothetical protein PM082_014931 [Marasmius tenuissimus]|nr:hypothetical protein PM082_014931 [Marasmius tenuissimus]